MAVVKMQEGLLLSAGDLLGELVIGQGGHGRMLRKGLGLL
jgi:hypothetical protein